jgi:hypothetical protein
MNYDTLPLHKIITGLTSPKKDTKEPKATKQYFVTRKIKSKVKYNA